MNSIKLKNFRGLKNIEAVQLKPITIVVGNNSSGKSTFLRLLPMFKQGCKIQKTSPILLNGPYADYGSFREAYCLTANGEDMEFEFQFSIPNISELKSELNIKKLTESLVHSWLDYSTIKLFIAGADLRINICINGDKNSGRSYVTKVRIYTQTDSFSVLFSSSGEITSCIVNEYIISQKELNLKCETISGVIPVSFFATIPNTKQANIEDIRAEQDEFIGIATKQLRAFFGQSKNTDSNIAKIIASFPLGSPNFLLSYLKQNLTRSKVLNELASHWDENSEGFKSFRRSLLIANFQSVLQYADQLLIEQFRKVSYIAPIRATAERFYRSQDLAIDEIDPQGRNLAVFIQGLSKTEQNAFSVWTLQNLGFAIRAEHSNGNISLYYRDSNSQREYNIADMGFGVSQLLPIAAQIWSQNFKSSRRLRSISSLYIPKIIVIEQPELHLHPAMQAKFADLMVSLCVKLRELQVNFKLVIETHSDVIIDRIGVNIINNREIANHVSIALFEKNSDTQETIVSEASFSEDGALLNWPFGFFEPSI